MQGDLTPRRLLLQGPRMRRQIVNRLANQEAQAYYLKIRAAREAQLRYAESVGRDGELLEQWCARIEGRAPPRLRYDDEGR